MLKIMSHFQNSVSFENGFGKTVQKAGFSTSKVAFSKTEVLKKPLMNFNIFLSMFDGFLWTLYFIIERRIISFLMHIYYLFHGARRYT